MGEGEDAAADLAGVAGVAGVARVLAGGPSGTGGASDAGATTPRAEVGALVLRDFFEAAAIVFFFVLSEWVQKWCVHHTADATADRAFRSVP